MVCQTCGKEFFEDYRKDPIQRRKPARFCSRACANGSSHRKYKEEIFCLNCGKSLGSGYQAKRSRFCSNKCQQELKTKTLIRDWLESGILENWTGGQSGYSPRAKYVREYLFSEQKNLCAICSNPAEHNGKPLVFVLDHIDGDSTNNERKNLRLICPNCDSQSQTFKNRNKGKGRRSLGFSANKGL